MAKQRKPTRANPSSAQASAFEKAWKEMRAPAAPRPTVSGRWLLAAMGIAIAGAALCCWVALCLLFWQGSWQLLYHPAATVARTPASLGLVFDAVAFAADETGQTRLKGWWIPSSEGARFSQLTILYLHGQSGNLGDALDELAALHAAGANVLAFDYRGFGQSQFARPSEAHWREDAEWALEYLTGTRQIAAGRIVLDGEGLGANLALETAAAHPELAGVILREPVANAANAIFDDARARLVPARLLVRDRYDLDVPAAALRVPSLWLFRNDPLPNLDMVSRNSVFEKVSARKMRVWIAVDSSGDKQRSEATARWLGGLSKAAVTVQPSTPSKPQ